MKNEKINNAIGNQLKQARLDKGWSLDTACQFTGVSKAMLGQIERGESSPTVAKLWDIANGFNFPLSYFISPINNGTDIKQVVDDGIVISTLFPFDKTTNIEVFSLCVSPKHQQLSSAHNEGVIEHILVVEGELEYMLDNTWHQLNVGEVVKFKADKPHGYRNMTHELTIFHNIICYPNR